jgi:hypothetical protein
MYKRSSHERGGEPRAPGLRNPFFEGIALGKVTGYKGRHPIIAGTPLTPSQPGCVGDVGAVLDNRITDVVREPEGLLHVIDGKLLATVGDLVLVRRDGERREQLERTHAATALVLAELSASLVEVSAVEIVAGTAWIEVCEPTPEIDLDPLVERGLPILPSPQRNGRLLVTIGDRSITTFFAPIARNTLDIGPTFVHPVSTLDDGHEVLEVSLAE